MKELLINSISTVSYTIYIDGVPTPAEGSVTAKVLKNGALPQDLSVSLAPGSTGTYSAIIDPALLSSESTLTVQWTFTIRGYTMTVSEDYDVVTPYAPWSYFEGQAKYKDFIECEKITRKVINSYCGQAFGKEDTTYAVDGTGTHGLRLPRRLLVLDTVKWIDHWSTPDIITAPPESDYTFLAWEIVADGWVLRTPRAGKRIDSAYIIPDSFKRNRTYNISGLWGHDSVPTAVEEASKILIANYLCQDQKYRDKYLESIATGDWDFKFAPQAFTGTGSVTADDLLKDYRMFPGIGVI